MKTLATVLPGIFYLLFASAVYALAESCETPLPDDVNIRTPAADVPEKYTGFSGRWGPGKWDGELCHVLVVETIDPEGEAEVIYSWGTSKRWNIKAGWIRNTGRIVGSKLKMKQPYNEDRVNYWLDGDILYGRYYGREAYNIELMRK